MFLSIFGQCLHQVRLFGRGGPAADLAVGSINVFVQSRSQLLKTPQQGLGKGNGCPRAPEIFRVAGAFEAAPRSGGLFRQCCRQGHGVYCEEIAWFHHVPF